MPRPAAGATCAAAKRPREVATDRPTCGVLPVEVLVYSAAGAAASSVGTAASSAGSAAASAS
eukprot:1666068-Prymnesium_polylepis.1